ncbi:MAG: hypothetical protein M3447_13245 [Acidobacteriota bacterium]|nr:hypothetical protein [Acidobacteriota bacterium]
MSVAVALSQRFRIAEPVATITTFTGTLALPAQRLLRHGRAYIVLSLSRSNAHN